jgi:hypothetical protein
MSSMVLGAVVEQVCSADLSAVDVSGLQADALAIEHAIGRLTGQRDRLLGEIEARGGALDEFGEPVPTYAWWRDATTVSGQQAARELRGAVVLRELPVIAAAVTAGELSPAQAGVLARLHDQIPAQQLLDSQADLIHVARGMNPEVLAQWVRNVIATHCEASLELEQAKARDRRYLQLRRDPDGTTRGSFRLPDEDAEVLLTVLEPLARKQGLGDQRAAGQRRADALVDVFAGAARWMDLPEAGGQRPQVTYVLGAGWCAGQRTPSLPERLAEAALTDRLGGTRLHPRALEEHTGAGAWTGPQTRARIEAVLCDARISRALLDERGQVQSLIAVSDQITAAQRKAVSARDRHCLAKGCHRPPAFCDVHHLDHRADGGATTVHNLVLLCRRHHLAWHRGTLRLSDLHTPWLDPIGEELPAEHNPEGLEQRGHDLRDHGLRDHDLRDHGRWNRHDLADDPWDRQGPQDLTRWERHDPPDDAPDDPPDDPWDGHAPPLIA